MSVHTFWKSLAATTGRRLIAGLAAIGILGGAPMLAQQNDAPAPQQEHVTHAADGQRHGFPAEAFAVAPGTRFLVQMEDDLNTGETRSRTHFRVRTLEPLEADRGIYLPAGAEIQAHVSRVQPAEIAGRARIWLTFDVVKTHFGPLPIVANVISIPGDHSLQVRDHAEGIVEEKNSTEDAALKAAGEAAGRGALPGVKHKNAKEAAEGAAVAALAAYMLEAGRGHELSIPKGAKLELELERSLYLVRD